MYKKCPSIKSFLFGILKTVWNQAKGSFQWSVANGIFIPKIMEASEIGDFRVIAKTNVEGKIFLVSLQGGYQHFSLATASLTPQFRKWVFLVSLVVWNIQQWCGI